MRLTLSTKIALLVIGAMGFVLLAVLFVLGESGGQTIREEVWSELLRTVSAVDRSLQRRMSTLETEAILVANQTAAKDALSSNDHATILDWARGYLNLIHAQS